MTQRVVPPEPGQPTGLPVTAADPTGAAGPVPDIPGTVDSGPITPAVGARVRAAVVAAVRDAARQDITQSVVVIDRHTGQLVISIGADARVPAMSVAKLFFAVDALDSAGGADYVAPATLGRLHLMIATSNDATADAVYGQDGGGQIIERMAARYHLPGTEPSRDPRYWGDIRITAADLASFLTQTLADPRSGPFLISAMIASTTDARDGFDQEFGMNAVAGAGSKQGWGCCLGGVVSIHSVGFTDDEIVVVLSTAAPDASGLGVPEVSAFADDPGFLASVAAAAATATARAATGPLAGGPPVPARAGSRTPPVPTR